MTYDSVPENAARLETLASKISTAPGSLDIATVQDLERIVSKLGIDPDFLGAEPPVARACHQLIETVARHSQRLN